MSTVPISIPIETPGATTAKQQTDALTDALGKLDNKAKQSAQTNGQAADQHNKWSAAIRKQAEETKKQEDAIKRADAAAKHWTTTALENEKATKGATAATRAHETAFNKMGEAFSKGSPAAGQAVKALGTTVGAVGLAASAVSKAVSVAWTAMVNHLVEESERGGKSMRSFAQVQSIIGDARTARDKEAAGNLEKNSPAYNTLVSVGGDSAVLAAQQFAKRNNEKSGEVGEQMAKMLNGGMSQEQAMNALQAAHEGSQLGYDSFAGLAGKAAGMPGKTFTGNVDKDISAIARSDNKEAVAGKMEDANNRAGKISENSRILNENAMAKYLKDDEEWQRLNNGGAPNPRDTPSEAARKYRNRPVRPDGKAKWMDQQPTDSDIEVGSVEDINARRFKRSRSFVGEQVDMAKAASGATALAQDQAGLSFGAGGAAQIANDTITELRNPGMGAINKERNRLSLERDVATSKADSLDNISGRVGASSESLEARADARRANEAMDRLTDALLKAYGTTSGVAPGTGPMPVKIVGGLSATANGE